MWESTRPRQLCESIHHWCQNQTKTFPRLLLQALQLPLHLLQLGVPVLHLGLRAGAARLSCTALLLCGRRGGLGPLESCLGGDARLLLCLQSPLNTEALSDCSDMLLWLRWQSHHTLLGSYRVQKRQHPAMSWQMQAVRHHPKAATAWKRIVPPCRRPWRAYHVQMGLVQLGLMRH